MDINMDIEYHFYDDVLTFLREIKRISLYSPKNKSGFPVLSLPLDKNDNLRIKQHMLYKLQEWGLVEIEKPEQNKIENQLFINFELTPKFEKIYNDWKLIWDDPFLAEITRIVKIKKLLMIKKQKLDTKIKNDETKESNPLLDAIKNNRKNKVVIKIAKKFIEKKKVENWVLASCTKPTIPVGNNKSRKFKKKDYQDGREKFNDQIKNRFDTLNKKWKHLNCRIKFHTDYSELISK